MEVILKRARPGTKGLNRLLIKGRPIAAESRSLIYEVQNIDKHGLLHLETVKLNGFWRSDENNRLAFELNKKGSFDILIFKGEWEINKNQQIVYNFLQKGLKSKTKTLNTLVFDGHWKIDSENKLSYSLGAGSEFNFKAQLESSNFYPKEGAIKYRIGVGFKEAEKKNRIISLFGTWKLSRTLGLSFVMDYGNGQVDSINFDTEIHFNSKDEAVFSIFNKNNEPLGFGLIYTRKFLQKNAAEAFLKLKKIREDKRIEAGVKIPW